MRTASDFDAYYKDADPWRISGVRSRDAILRRSMARFVTGKKVLELGCGEGHLTQALFWDAASVKGIDISGVAIGRAISKGLSNASFENSDFLDVSYEGYGVIAELSPKVGDGGNREGGISWGGLTPPLLHRRSDMPCPTITSSN